MFKKTILLIVLLFVINKTKATVITVSNAPNSPAQYNALQLAINAANNGDTIYVSGSLVSYGDITIDRKLVLIGSGFNPQKEIPLTAQINALDFISGSSGSSINGFTFIGSFPLSACNGAVGAYTILSSTCGVDSISIKNNHITGSYPNLAVGGNNWLIERNVIGRINVVNNFNVMIKNNIVYHHISLSNDPSVAFSNNLFINAANICFYDISNAVISNNIFYGAGPINCINSIFNKNLTFNTAQNTLPYGTNIGAGNIINQDPQFSAIQSIDYTFDFLDDYRLLLTSPGHNAGTDGTDIGPFGGFNPFPSSPIGGEPQIPQVKNMNINNTSLPLNGNLNINVKGKKQD
jgi:hypothetical protein